MANWTDEKIAKLLAEDGHSGYKRAAGYLEEFTPEVRDDIVSEAHTMCNIVAGWRWADCVWEIAQKVKKGQPITYYRDQADKWRQAEQARKDAELKAAAAAFHRFNS